MTVSIPVHLSQHAIRRWVHRTNRSVDELAVMVAESAPVDRELIRERFPQCDHIRGNTLTRLHPKERALVLLRPDAGGLTLFQIWWLPTLAPLSSTRKALQ